jgi:hypothetical protein
MATTPESKVKDKIKEILEEFNVYYFMPVQMGYGAAGVDFHCVVDWRNLPIAFFIEAKDRDKDTTPRQDEFLKNRRQKQKCTTFVIDGLDGYRRLRLWLAILKSTSMELGSLSLPPLPSLLDCRTV